MDALRTRVLDLERQVHSLRRERRIFMGSLGLMMLLFCLGAARPELTEVRAQRFVLVDAKGRECGQLAAGPHGGVLDLLMLHHHGQPVGLHAEGGELRVREMHGDDVLYVGMLGTRCYGLLSVEPPASAQVTTPCSLELRAQNAVPRLRLASGSRSWGVEVGPEGSSILQEP